MWSLLFAIALVSCYGNSLSSPCDGCLQAKRLLQLQKQLEALANEVTSLRKNSEGM